MPVKLVKRASDCSASAPARVELFKCCRDASCSNNCVSAARPYAHGHVDPSAAKRSCKSAWCPARKWFACAHTALSHSQYVLLVCWCVPACLQGCSEALTCLSGSSPLTTSQVQQTVTVCCCRHHVVAGCACHTTGAP
jgi:hypothetical protein